MAKTKLYDLVHDLLNTYQELRNSDKRLLWAIWYKQGLVNAGGYITRENFYRAATAESVTRARRKVQELHPELVATSSEVRAQRQQKENTKGTFVFREGV